MDKRFINYAINEQPSYFEQYKAIYGNTILQYLPMHEKTGTTALDLSGHNYHGVYKGTPELASVDFLRGLKAPRFGASGGKYLDALNSGVNTGLMTTYPTGTIAAWIWLPDWTAPAASRYIVRMNRDSSNRTEITHLSTAANRLYFLHRAGGTGAGMINTDEVARAGWVRLLITWDATTCSYYINNKPIITDQAKGTWAGSLLTLLLGAYNGGINIFEGSMCEWILTSGKITAAQAIADTQVFARPLKLLVLGDSIAAASGIVGWADLLAANKYAGIVHYTNRAVASTTIVTHLAGQVAAAANDNADIAIIGMGTNDNDAGDMAALRAVVEAQLLVLKGYNPNMRIYYMNVLPRFDAVAKTNIRVAIAAGCLAQGVTCWDTVTTPWIEAADTSDNVHPTAAGHVKIYNQVMTRIGA